MINIQKERVYQFLKNHNLCVVSLVDDHGLPISALVEFVVDNDLNLYFGTNRKFRKAKALRQSKAVSVVVGGREDACVQMQAYSQKLAKDNHEKCKKELVSRLQQNYFPIVPEDDFIFFKLTSDWVRYTDVSAMPWNVYELDL